MRIIREAVCGLAIATLTTACGGVSRADGIQDPGLPGTTQYDAWTTLHSAANPGFPTFPGSGAWPGAIGSNLGGDAELTKVANGAGGGPFPAGGSLYFGGFSGDINTFGGTLSVGDSTPVADLANLVLQIDIGEAATYDFFDHVLPVLNLNGGAQALAASYAVITSRVSTGVFQTPEGPEEVYRNVHLLQWDLSGISEPITSFSIAFSGAQHAQIYGMRLDQSDVFASLAPTQAVPEPASMALLLVGVAALGVGRLRRP